MQTTLQDLRYSLRDLAGNRSFTVAAILSIALGIAANAVIFSLVSALLIRPLAVPRPDGLVRVGGSIHGRGHLNLSVANYREITAAPAFDGVAAHRFNQIVLNVGNQPRVAGVEIVSDNYFEVLGAKAARGRTFAVDSSRRSSSSGTAADVDAPTAEPGVVISHATWQSRLAGDAQVIGRPLKLSGQPFTIIGVMPPDFGGSFPGFAVEVWVPLSMHDRVLPDRGSPSDIDAAILNLTARLAPEASEAEARAQLHVIANRQRTASAELPDGWDLALARANGVHPMLADIATAFLSLLQGVVGLLLLIACANVANLLLTRGAVRRSELAVRSALGASRPRLIRQLLTESLLLVSIGGTGGLLLAAWIDTLLSRVALPTGVPVDLELSVDSTVLLFGVAACVFTGAVFGVVPALRSSRCDLTSALKHATRLGGSSQRLHRALVVVQISVSTVLLVGAGLMGRTLLATDLVDTGIRADDLVVVSSEIGVMGYEEERTRSYWQQLRARAESRPEIESATLALFVTLGDRSDRMEVWPQGRPPGDHPKTAYNYNAVSVGYMEMLGVALVAGRSFLDTDTEAAQEVVILNEVAAQQLWSDGRPIGRSLVIRDRIGGEHVARVVGVAANTTYRRLGEAPTPFMYLPESQWFRADMVLHARSRGASANTIAALVDEARAVDPEVPVEVAPMVDVMAFALIVPRLLGGVLGVAGAIGFGLASVGIFGMVAYSTERRRHEIGVRVALGASANRVRQLVLAQGARLTLIGLTLGLAVAGLTSRLIGSFLYNVSPTDPITFTSVALGLGGVGLIAGWLPTRRALRIDPVVVLRGE